MSEENGQTSGNGFAYLAIGALLVAAGVLAYFFFNPSPADQTSPQAAAERIANSPNAGERTGLPTTCPGC